MSERKAFNFYRSYYEVAKDLHPKEREQFLFALLQKQFDNIEPNMMELLPMARFAYRSQKHSIDSQVIGFEKKTGVALAPPVGGSVGGRQGGSVQEEEKEEGEYTHPGFTFEEFWLIYPKKVAKEKCKGKFNKLTLLERDRIKESINRFILYKPFPGYNHPNPETYLNQKRWDDVIPEPEKSKQPVKSYEEMSIEERKEYRRKAMEDSIL